MTKTEARKVVRIALTADDGCTYCAHQLLAQLEEDFPKFDWDGLAREADPYWEPREEYERLHGEGR